MATSEMSEADQVKFKCSVEALYKTYRKLHSTSVMDLEFIEDCLNDVAKQEATAKDAWHCLEDAAVCYPKPCKTVLRKLIKDCKVATDGDSAEIVAALQFLAERGTKLTTTKAKKSFWSALPTLLGVIEDLDASRREKERCIATWKEALAMAKLELEADMSDSGEILNDSNDDDK